MLITVEQLKSICPKMPAVRAIAVSEAVNKVCPHFNYNADILHEFLANVLHESLEFSTYSENLNYTTAKQLMKVWPSRFKTEASAEPFLRNPQKLANYVYGGRMGNIQPNDGYEFRGAGPIQITGRDMFTAFSRYMRITFEDTRTAQEWAAALRSSDHEVGMYSACWIFSIAKGLNQAAIDDEMLKIVKRINGGVNGLADRLRYYELCKKYIPE